MPKSLFVILPLLIMATAAAPRFFLSMGIACIVLSSVAFVGAWLVDRYAPLPGTARRTRLADVRLSA